MKIETYKKKIETEEPLYLKLIDSGSDAVLLAIVDKEGIPIHGGSILYIDENGITLQKHINSKFNLPLDKQEQIKVNHR